jgi:hypothetical protein
MYPNRYSIAMYLNRYASTLLKIKTKKLYIKIIIYFFLKIQTAQKHSGGYLTIVFGMQYLK